MLSFKVISVMLGFAFLASALPGPLPYRPYRPYRPDQPPTVSRRRVASKQAITAINVIDEPDFLISNVFASTVSGSSNRTLSFVFADPNSNTSTTCSSSWTETNTTTTRPMGPSYQLCDRTNSTAKPEYFQWFFNSYTAPDNFTLELAHDFSDPVHYPPPYDYVEYFASAAVGLTCDAAGTTGCALPSSTSPIHATITSLSN